MARSGRASKKPGARSLAPGPPRTSPTSWGRKPSLLAHEGGEPALRLPNGCWPSGMIRGSSLRIWTSPGSMRSARDTTTRRSSRHPVERMRPSSAGRASGQTGDWKDWAPNWLKMGDVHLDLAEDAARARRTVSATEAYQRAAWCYHLGKVLWFEGRAPQ